jgi:glucosamine--fructose-6-phosphate aminotransferase (isomerizing)
MCGLIGYVGRQAALPLLLGGLRRLEYRGYDSAGVALQAASGQLTAVRAVGKVVRLTEKVTAELTGTLSATAQCGIAHTRWATHGAPTEKNAHPHFSGDGRLCLVHNGIIENYRAIRARLEAKGHAFVSETDTEALVRLIGEHYQGDLRKAVGQALALSLIHI